MTTEQTDHALRLPASTKAEAEDAAKAEGISLDDLLIAALTEKLAVLRTEARYRRLAEMDVSPKEALAILNRAGTEDPIEGDEIPDHLKDRFGRP